MFKFLLVVAVAGAIFWFTPQGQAFKGKALNIVNPTASERQSLTMLKRQVAAIANTVSEPAFQRMSQTERNAVLAPLVAKANQSITLAQEQTQKLDLGATLSSAISKYIPGLGANSCQTK